MLILSRKRGEAIDLYGGLISVYVVEIRGNKVRLGIEAPQECRVDRREITELIRAAAAAAAAERIASEERVSP